MATDLSSTRPANPFSDFRAAQAVLSLELHSVVRVDSFQVITYDHGHFMLRTQVVNGPSPLNVRILTPDEMVGLHAALVAEARNPPAGLDTTALRTFIQVLSHAIENAASTRFDTARFGNIATDSGGAIVGHLGLGVDVVGTVHDAHHVVTFEQHPLPLPPGPFRHLSHPDRESLGQALKNFIDTAQPPANALWSQVLKDLRV